MRLCYLWICGIYFDFPVSLPLVKNSRKLSKRIPALRFFLNFYTQIIMTDQNQNIEDEPKKSFVIFGRDVTQIPCFRNSFLYGISGGIVVGALTFLATSRPKFSTNIGFGTFFCGTIVYWCSCRYEWSKKRFQYSQLQAAMKKHAIYEGTDLERKIREKSEDA